jgi:hypothetical protein
MDNFPLYHVIEDGHGKFLTLRRAGVLSDSMFSKVVISGLVLNEDFSTRQITEDEMNQIVEIADRHSDSK